MSGAPGLAPAEGEVDRGKDAREHEDVGRQEAREEEPGRRKSQQDQKREGARATEADTKRKREGEDGEPAQRRAGPGGEVRVAEDPHQQRCGVVGERAGVAGLGLVVPQAFRRHLPRRDGMLRLLRVKGACAQAAEAQRHGEEKDSQVGDLLRARPALRAALLDAVSHVSRPALHSKCAAKTGLCIGAVRALSTRAPRAPTDVAAGLQPACGPLGVQRTTSNAWPRCFPKR